MSDLPQGWSECRLEDLTEDVTYGYTAKSSTVPIGPRMLRITDIQNNKVNWDGVPFCHISKIDKAKYQLKCGDLVFARTGATVGKSFLISGDIPETVYASYLIRVRCTLDETVGYLNHFFKSPLYWNQITEFSAGIGQPNVNGSKLKQLVVPLATLNEQKRIADKLDTLLAAVDACRARLDKVPTLIKRFRQSVLAAATSGALTEDWREKRNLAAQQHELASDERHFAEWKKVKLADVVSEMKNGLSPKPSAAPPGNKILRISAVRPGRIDFEDHRFLEVSEKEDSQFSLVFNDLLFTRYNGTQDFVGVCALVRNEIKGYVYPDKLIRVRVNESLILAAYVEIVFGTPMVRNQIKEFIKSSAGQKGISGGDLKTTEFSLPLLEEQQEIVRRVESLFTVADKLEASLVIARKRVGQLTPAILAQAFRGELVAQDRTDEPASALLARIADATAPKRALKKAA